jgi:preprotein translocase subunit SecG
MRSKENNRKNLKEQQTKMIKENFKINKKTKNKIYTIMIILFMLLVIFLVIWYKKDKDVKVSEANNSRYEIYTETKGYVLSNETIVEYDKNETLIPIAESEKRITVDSVIGIYKNKEYEEGLKQLSKIDDEINQKLQLLPEIYSNEVISIDKEIDTITKQIKDINSYIQIGDYKTKLDKLAYDKALTVSSLTPSGSDVKSLILERDEYKENMNKSSNNVKAPISGIIIYENDGLENKFAIDNMDKFNQEKIDKVITEYDKTKEETFGIKIVDN